MSIIRVSIVVEASHLHRYAEIVLRCQEAGLTVERQMRVIGAISGTIEISKLSGLLAIDGVRDVEPSRDVHCLGAATRPAKAKSRTSPSR